MRRLIWILILTALNNVINAQEIVADRPDQTESSTTIPLKSFQMEFGFGSGNYNNEKILLIPSSLLRYGLWNGIELRLAEQVARIAKNANSENKLGLSDMELGLKIQILKNENINTQLAIVSHFVIPTGTSDLTNIYFGTINKLAVSHSLTEHLDLGYNLGYNYLGLGKGDLTYSLALGIGLSDKIGMYLETYGEYSDLRQINSNLDGGFTYLLKKNLQLDFSIGIGINQKMNYFSLGFSWNINRNKKE